MTTKLLLALFKSAVLFILLCLSACSGNAENLSLPTEPTPSNQIPELPIAEAASPPLCAALPPIPQPPANAKRVTDPKYGAIPNDNKDDTASIQKALNELKKGEWLIFPEGRFDHNTSLAVSKEGTTIWGEAGATLFATNAYSMSLMVTADDVAIYNLTFKARTMTIKEIQDSEEKTARKSSPQHTAIAVYDAVNSSKTQSQRRFIQRTTIRGNTITLAHETQDGQTNSASSAGIFIHHAQNFLVAENTVKRSLADGIQVTGGSRNGRVIGNYVSQTGDDGISIVSYNNKFPEIPFEETNNNLTELRDGNLARNILVQDNEVRDIYWGRGLSLVGGVHITFLDNTVSHSPSFAGLYLARDLSYQTFGIADVLVKRNDIGYIQTGKPNYDFNKTTAIANGKEYTIVRSKQGGIEIYSHVLEGELSYPTLKDAYSVKDIRLENNTIHDTLSSAIRVAAPITGKKFNNETYSLKITGLSLINNNFTHIKPPEDRPIDALSVANGNVKNDGESILYCSNNTDDNPTNTAGPRVVSSSPQCKASVATLVVGAGFGNFCKIE
ncbi:MAG: right-handed parallel beta-helix repeat-containing protein [Trueperaceae bacterium]